MTVQAQTGERLGPAASVQRLQGWLGQMPAPAHMVLTPACRDGRRRALRAMGAGRGLLRTAMALAVVLIATGLTVMLGHALGPSAGVAGAGVLVLYAASVAWTASAAVISLCGLLPRRWFDGGAEPFPAPGPTRSRTAILLTVCGEDPAPIAAEVRRLLADLTRARLRPGVDIFLLSDTGGAEARAEARMFDSLRALPGVWWRQRTMPEGRKPGNLADWLGGWGGAYDHMLVLDADSRMTATRIGRLIRRMEGSPGTGLIQAGMRLVPATSRFGALQRLSARLCGPGFGRGLSAWTGSEGNFWGHNALIRVEAFAAVAQLPQLSGSAPWGGSILSHDFVEAALIRRDGWAVEIDPDARGSFEDGPQQLEPFHRRDRRWCQGNLQHLRLLTAGGLHPASRLHLLMGILSYLVAPMWLALVLTVALGTPGIDTFLPLLAGLALLAVPKAVGTALWLAQARTAGRRRVVLRAAGVELALSTLLAPIMLWRQSVAVASVAMGRDSGWQPSGRRLTAASAPGRVELAGGLALGAVTLTAAAPAHWPLLAPILLPLLAAPWVVRWLDGPHRCPIRQARPAPRLAQRAAA